MRTHQAKRLIFPATFCWLLLAVLDASVAVGAAGAGCDYDGNGYGDLAIGSPTEEEGDLPREAGAVNVIYGTSEGLSAAGDQFWTLDSAGIAGGPAESYDWFGVSIECGDFNGDDFDDLAVGAPQRDAGFLSEAGIVVVLYGSNDGLSTEESQAWDLTDVEADIGDDELSLDSFGAVLAVGDFDADGRDDLAVGAPWRSGGSGAVAILYGTSDGLSGARSQYFFEEMPGLAGEPGEYLSFFGYALAAGDFDQNGKDDLVIGMPLYTFEEQPDFLQPGAVVVLYGRSYDGLTVVNSEFWSQDSVGVKDIDENGDGCGTAVAAGDFNADGFDDLAMGCPGETVKGPQDDYAGDGALHIIYGYPGGLSAKCNGGHACQRNDQLFHQAKIGVSGKPDGHERFGAALVSADFNADGIDDLALGAPGEREHAPESGGVVYVFYGRENGLYSREWWWHQDIEDVEGVTDAYEQFGRSLAAGDFDGDGAFDLAIGVPYDDSVDKGQGGVNVLYGTLFGPHALGNQLWHQDVEDRRSAELRCGVGFGSLNDPVVWDL